MKTIDPNTLPYPMRGIFYLCVDLQQPRNLTGTFSAPPIPTTRYKDADKAAEYGGKYTEPGRDVFVLECHVVRVMKHLPRKFWVQAVAETPESSRSTEDRQQRTEEQPATSAAPLRLEP
jgi:hypothetical protein